MKKKFIIFTLCFTLIFSSLNYKKSYADMGVISAPMIGVVCTVAAASGIVLNNNDEIVEFANMFYQTNKENWQEINNIFKSCVSIGANKVVTVGKDFLNKVYDFLDILKVTSNGLLGSIKKVGDLTVGANYYFKDYVTVNGDPYVFDNIYILKNGKSYPFAIYSYSSSSYYVQTGYMTNSGFVKLAGYNANSSSNFNRSYISFINLPTDNTIIDAEYYKIVLNYGYGETYSHDYVSNHSITYDYTVPGTYDKTLVNDNLKEDESIDIYVPGNVSSLPGVVPGEIIYNPSSNPPYDLPTNGVVSVPNVSNPSISVDNTVTIPNVGDFPSVDSPSVPSEGIWSTIKDFIISLVVPSDSFWTDTWGGLYNNFTNSFPMVDMDGFNDLVTGEKKFPNIDINIMGTSGRVVNGDVINSIVDWLRPIVAGFMMLCLMLFNYRKIYKLIRNTEPFGGIAPGTSDFSTGISEYSKQEVVKATDMVAEYRAWRERGGK